MAEDDGDAVASRVGLVAAWVVRAARATSRKRLRFDNQLLFIGT